MSKVEKAARQAAQQIKELAKPTKGKIRQIYKQFQLGASVDSRRP
jgi:hypothetical protein